MKFKPIFAIAACVMALAACSKHAHLHQPATEPVPREELWWHQINEQNTVRAKQGGKKIQLIFIGDSITELMKTAHPEMDAAWPKENPQEFGISGDMTQHVLWRLQHGELDGLSPKVAVLLIGTNNLNDNSDEQIFDGIKLIVEDLRKRMPTTKVIVLALLPRGDTATNIYRKRVAGVNQLLGTKIADNTNVFYTDVGSVFLQPDGVMKVALMPDYLHPSVAGYKVMFEALKPTVDKLLATNDVVK